MLHLSRRPRVRRRRARGHRRRRHRGDHGAERGTALPDPPACLTASLVARLAAAGCVALDDEARELVADAPADAELEARVRRREGGEPLAWIVGGARGGGG